MESPGEAHSAPPRAFAIRDCALVAVATGKKARILQEFRHILEDINVSSIYHHFWGGLLQPRFEEREYNNDFAAWFRHAIHDPVLAERLAALDPTAFPDLEALRREIIEQIETRTDEVEYLQWARATQQFEFLSSQIVIFDTRRELRDPAELATHIGDLSTSSIFYHFVDARRRTPDARDDFTEWLSSYDGGRHGDLIENLAGVDPYFGSLSELRTQLARLFREHILEPAQ